MNEDHAPAVSSEDRSPADQINTDDDDWQRKRREWFRQKEEARQERSRAMVARWKPKVAPAAPAPER